MDYLKKHIQAYELIAFASGFALMAYELAGARILSPVVGSSTYVWTSIIGVIVAALSLGYAVGGVVADRRVKPSDVAILLLASSLTAVLTVYLSESVLSMATRTFNDARMQGLVASVALFMPTSFMLGMISPYLVRLRTASVATVGTSVASLSALNAIGGILGTLCTGFIFFGYFGSSQSMIFIGALLVLASWLLVPKQYMLKRTVATVCIVMVGLVGLLPGRQDALASIDTPSAHYTVIESIYPDNGVHKQTRMLLAGAASAQSGVYLTDPEKLVFDYTRKMAELVDRADHKQTVLLLGGGAFTLPRHLAEQYPSSQIDVVEIDPQLVSIAEQYFAYTSPANVRVISQDARAFFE